MKKQIIPTFLVASALGLPVLAQAQSDTQSQINELKKRIASLEQQKVSSINSAIKWSGALEIEANYTDNYQGDSESDIVVATANLAAEAQLNADLLAVITLLHEEDDTDLEVDEAFLSYAINDKFALTLGQIYLPFGQYQTSAINDPLTLELGETRESAALISYEEETFSADFYLFNGDTDVNGDVIDNFGARLTIPFTQENAKGSVSVDFTSNLLDSDTIGDSGANFDENIEGLAVSVAWAREKWGASAEWLTAMTDIDSTIVAFNGKDTQPSALHLEAYCNSTVAEHDATYAIGFHRTEEALALELPETRISVSASVAVYENVALSAELFRDSDYDKSDSSGGIDGSGEDSTTLLFQVASEF